MCTPVCFWFESIRTGRPSGTYGGTSHRVLHPSLGAFSHPALFEYSFGLQAAGRRGRLITQGSIVYRVGNQVDFDRGGFHPFKQC
jgi:hypothetical protein